MTHPGDAAIRILQIVIAGLMAGLVLLTAVALAIHPLIPDPDPGVAQALLAAVVLLAIGSAAAYLALQRSLARTLAAEADRLRVASDPTELVIEPYRRFVIAGGGLIEGPAFFAVVVYMLTGRMVLLAAVVVGLFLLAAHLPSVDKLRRLADEAARSSSLETR